VPWLGKYAGSIPLAARPYLSGPHPEGLTSGAVGLFVGCGANYLYPAAARAAVRLLEAQGLRVVAPAAQLCCGLPAYSAGDAASAQALAERNLAAFEGCETIVALCASCAYRLRGYGGLPEVRLLPELLAPAPPRAGRRRLRLAYHAPCHARFEGAGTGPALKLLGSLPHVELLPAEEGCCGSGGLFALSHPELSAAILRERLRGLLALRPEAIATDCSGCLIQLRSGLAELGQDIPVVHIAQVVAGRPLR
jgi:glycolate oxidase iron-sulfur subunit